jgi:hypothetical protein
MYIMHALYVQLEGGKGMDTASWNWDVATLYQVRVLDWGENETEKNGDGPSTAWCRAVRRGTLQEVNDACREIQRSVLAPSLRDGRMDGGGLVLVSCHPELFSEALRAAADRQRKEKSGGFSMLPVTGSGGTSLSRVVQAYGLQLAGNAGGSVATTSYTRAVSYAQALASHYRIPYRPWTMTASTATDGNPHQTGPTWTSVLNSCLPAFWAVCLLRFGLDKARMLLASQRFQDLSWVDLPVSFLVAYVEAALRAIETWILPASCAVTMATNAAAAASLPTTTGSTSHDASDPDASCLILASLVASAACSSSIVAGLVAGYLVALGSNRALYWCIFRNVPATMTTLIAGGGVGAAVALIVLPVAPALGSLTAGVRGWILASVSTSHQGDTLTAATRRALAGASWGVLSCYACKVGLYHAVHLPLILVEMETTGSPGFLGAVDELTLVLVCAGVCAGHLASRRLFGSTVSEAELDLCRRGLRTNVWFGDFVECCYPFMEASWIVNLGGYMGSAVSSGWLVASANASESVPGSLAYLPLPLSILLADKHWVHYAVACALAAGIPFLATLFQQAIHSRVGERKKQQ